MGQPMVLRLLEQNCQVTAYNRTKTKLEPLTEAGATAAGSPGEVLQQADCTILMLSDAAAIENTLLSGEAKDFLDNHTIIQMGTIAPSQSKSIHDAIVAAGGEYLEAPVLGSIPQVKTGELIVMVGSTPEQFAKYSELLKHYSPEPIYVGEVGKAAAIKLALNQLIAGLTSTFALSLSLVQHQGVNIEQFMDIVRQSALYAPTFDKKLARMCDRNFDNPNFPTKHLLKDTNLFLEQGLELGLNVNSLEGIKQVIERAIALGLAEQDYSSVYSAINQAVSSKQ